jgi:hypothetical protein
MKHNTPEEMARDFVDNLNENAKKSEAEPVIGYKDGTKSDASLHAPMLDDKEAEALSDKAARKVGEELGLSPDIIDTLLGQ